MSERVPMTDRQSLTYHARERTRLPSGRPACFPKAALNICSLRPKMEVGLVFREINIFQL